MKRKNLAWRASNPRTGEAEGVGETIALAYEDAKRRGSDASCVAALNYLALKDAEDVARARRELSQEERYA